MIGQYMYNMTYLNNFKGIEALYSYMPFTAQLLDTL